MKKLLSLAGYEQLFTRLDRMFNRQVPAFPGAAVPKIGLPAAVLRSITVGAARRGRIDVTRLDDAGGRAFFDIKRP